MKDGVFSPWNGQLALQFLPDFLTSIYSETKETISANIGRFGPYVMHDGDFRSLKKGSSDDVYTIELPRALEIFKEEKKVGRRGRKKKEYK